MTWRFLVDEDVSRLITRSLEAAGYDTEDVRDVGLRAHADQDVFLGRVRIRRPIVQSLGD